tara:strand:+ start:1623 stop:2390 length:768 start_codon:yes stop_codon:yes gene_type:complete
MHTENDIKQNIAKLKSASTLQKKSIDWINLSAEYRYSYNFSWLGRRAIQLPNDTWAMQELIWSIKPDLIIETGIAHGGSLIFSASMLALLDYSDAVKNNKLLDPNDSNRKVLGIDIDIRSHNREAIHAHPFSHKIEMIEGSSVSNSVIEKVYQRADKFETILVCLDSNHTHEHVLAEIEAYSKLVTLNSYLVVFDTIVEHMPESAFPNRPWGIGDNPKTAVDKFLENNSDFVIDQDIDAKLQISVAPGGFLRKVR